MPISSVTPGDYSFQIDAADPAQQRRSETIGTTLGVHGVETTSDGYTVVTTKGRISSKSPTLEAPETPAPNADSLTQASAELDRKKTRGSSSSSDSDDTSALWSESNVWTAIIAAEIAAIKVEQDNDQDSEQNELISMEQQATSEDEEASEYKTEGYDAEMFGWISGGVSIAGGLVSVGGGLYDISSINSAYGDYLDASDTSATAPEDVAQQQASAKTAWDMSYTRIQARTNLWSSLNQLFSGGSTVASAYGSAATDDDQAVVTADEKVATEDSEYLSQWQSYQSSMSNYMETAQSAIESLLSDQSSVANEIRL
jgi:hypothetical protein